MIQEWMTTLGANAKVMILDSGIGQKCTASPVGIKNFTDAAMDSFAQHGTDMAEIIAGRDPMDLGVAPYCELFIAKVWQRREVNWKAYEGALQWAIENEAQVVSMSFGMTAVSPGFKMKLKALDDRGTICLAAFSSLSGLRDNPNIITVGRLGPQTGATALVAGEINKRAANGEWRTLKGASVSTATLAGVAACAKAANPALNRLGFLKQINL